MKILHKSILSILFLMIALSAMGQQRVVVGYGETFETIANKYGVSISELQAANPGKEICYVGMELVVPQPTVSPVGNPDVTSPVLWIADSLLLEAKSLNISGNNNKAIKLYNKVLEMNVRTPYAYAGRAGCYYNLDKYKKAKEDLRQALSFNQLSEEEKVRCEDALVDVEKEIQAKRERKNRLWTRIGLGFATAAAVTATAYVASEQAKMQNQYNQNQYNQNPTHVYYGAGSDHLRNVDQIIAQSDASINQMRAQGTARLNQMTQNMMVSVQQMKLRNEEAFREELKWTAEFKKTNGRYPTEYETDRWYEAHYPDLLNSRILARGEMYEKMQNNNDGGNGSSSDDEIYKGKMSPEYYQQAYRRYEHLVESHFNSLTVVGSKYEDKKGNIRGTTGDMKGWAVVGISSNFRDAQREMRKIRLEAAKYGVNIAESRWETATTSIR